MVARPIQLHAAIAAFLIKIFIPFMFDLNRNLSYPPDFFFFFFFELRNLLLFGVPTPLKLSSKFDNP